MFERKTVLKPIAVERTCKKGMDGGLARKEREKNYVQLRKTHREESTTKRRQQCNTAAAISSSSSAFISLSSSSSSDKASSSLVVKEKSSGHEVEALITALELATSDEVLTVLETLCRYSMNPRNSIASMMKSNLINKIISYISSPQRVEIHREACTLLVNLTSGTKEHTDLLIGAGVLDTLLTLMTKVEDSKVHEEVVWALANIAGDYGHQVLRHPANVPSMLVHYCTPKFTVVMLQNVMFAMRNLVRTLTAKSARRSELAPLFEQLKGFIQPVIEVLKHVKDKEVIEEAWTILSSFANDKTAEDSQIKVLLEAGVMDVLVPHLNSSNGKILKQALNCLAHLSSGAADWMTDALMSHEILPPLKRLLCHPSDEILLKVLHTISNLVAVSKYVPIIFDVAHGFLPLIVTLVGGRSDVQKEAVFVLHNAAENPEMLQLMDKHGAVKALCDVLDVPDAKTVLTSMIALEYFLKLDLVKRQRVYRDQVETLGGLDAFEKLQHNENETIYYKAVCLITKYFGEDTHEDSSAATLIAPAVSILPTVAASSSSSTSLSSIPYSTFAFSVTPLTPLTEGFNFT